MRVVIGRVGRPHGIRGELTIEPRTDEPAARFASGRTILTENASLVIERSAFQGKRLIVKFTGIDDRNAAESLRGTWLEIERDLDERPDDPDEYYDTALMGLRAIYPGGAELGVVREVLHLPGQDVIAIDSSGVEILVPFVREFVLSVDLERGEMTVEPPPGLVTS